MKIIADTHTHSIACDHAYSTVLENAVQAANVGLKHICLTEHAVAMPGSPSIIYFKTLRNLPRVINGVTILKGAELNIMDYSGKVDLPDEVLEDLEWVIASYHGVILPPADIKSHTRGWMNIAANPLIHVIGHCGNPSFNFEHKPVLQAFKDSGKVVEINSHSFMARKGSYEHCREIAILCAEIGVPVVVSSDAHHSSFVGAVDRSVALLEEIGFPEELILNADEDRFLSAARKLSGKSLAD